MNNNQPNSLETFIKERNSNPITFDIIHINEVNTKVCELFIQMYKLQPIIACTLVDKYLKSYLLNLKDTLYAVIEAPYVDKIYRDIYYKYYSSKLLPYHRDCIRISFFDRQIERKEFRSPQDGDKRVFIENVEKNFCGFLIIRPTFPKIIGRNAISPKALKDDKIECCLSQINTTVASIKLKVRAFPHASQDNQTMTCAETTIWSILEYFGNKYPDYKPVLFSEINNILHKFSYKRLLPSDGLTAEQITFTIRELGFGAVIYSKSKQQNSDFPIEYLISTYIESGIPIICVLKNDKIGHAVNIVGRECIKDELVCKYPYTVVLKNGTEITDFNKFEKRYVFIDDNYSPYQLSQLNRPCKTYYTDKPEWHDCEIQNIIIPLYSKIYLDATRASKNFYKIFENPDLGFKDNEPRIIKIFLASTRSYKEYIACNKSLHMIAKELILALTMPKFIWVAEVSKKESYAKGHCDELYLQDATEPIEYVEKSLLSNLSFLASYTGNEFYVNNFGEFKQITTFACSFEKYNNNLR